MKQWLRFVLQPWTFFNQLQWSRNHWMILGIFLALAVVESHIGSRQQAHRIMAETLALHMGWSFNFALGALTAARLSLLLAAAFLGATALWFLGSLLGQQSSQRVLFRRLAVVATVILFGYTSRHFTELYAWADTVGWAVIFWGCALGYFAIREQFGLSRTEGLILASFAIISGMTSWQITEDIVERAVQQQVAKRPAIIQKHLIR